MSDPNDESAAAKKARSARNIVLALGLFAFVVLVFIVTITRIGGNVTAHGF
ncbi:MAG: hypothetical protein ACHP7N_14300 [Caulobacterales bacterium]